MTVVHHKSYIGWFHAMPAMHWGASAICNPLQIQRCNAFKATKADIAAASTFAMRTICASVHVLNIIIYIYKMFSNDIITAHYDSRLSWDGLRYMKMQQ